MLDSFAVGMPSEHGTPGAGFGGIMPQANSVPRLDAPEQLPRAIMSHKFHVAQAFKGNHLPAFELEHCGSFLYDK